jgi:hypothetical protein
MKRTRLLVLLVVIALAAITVTSPILARNGGVGNSADQQIGCAGTSKHSAGSAAITMAGSPLNPQPGQLVTVWINVTGAVASRFLGVIIASSLTATDTRPSADGWTIISNPSGSTFNYNEKTSATAGVNTFIWTLNAPASGSHTLYSKAFYPGSSSTTYTQGLTFTVSAGTPVPPTVVFNTPVASTNQSGTSMSVTATVTPGSAALQSVTLTVNGVSVAPSQTVSSPSWTVDTTAFPNGSRTLIVTATSAAGTGTATISVNFSNPGPTVAINSPISGSTVSNTIGVAITATSLPGSALGSVSIRVDTGTSITLPAPYTYQFDTTGLTNGAHTITATATDNLGRTGSGQSSFTVNNHGPSVSITQPMAGSSLSGNVMVNATLTPGSTSSPIIQAVLSVDGTALQTLTATPYTFSLNTTAFADGVHSLTVRATDASSNNGSQTMTVTFSNGAAINPPSVQISFPVDGQTVTGAIYVNTTVTAGTNIVSYVTMSVDGTVVGNITAGPFDYALDTAGYANGIHAINVTVHDTAGLHGSASVSLTFSNAAASVPSLGVLNILQQSSTALVSVNVTGVVSYVTVSVDGAVVANRTAAPYSFTIDTTALSDGQHTVVVTATGTGGSASAESTISVSNAIPRTTGTDLSRWQATIIGGSVLLIGGVAFMVASVLMLRRSKMRRLR